MRADLPWDVAAIVATLRHRIVKAYWEHSARTVWPAPETYIAMHRIAERLLPGVRYRRHLLCR